jgi:hypothetical protein
MQTNHWKLATVILAATTLTFVLLFAFAMSSLSRLQTQFQTVFIENVEWQNAADEALTSRGLQPAAVFVQPSDLLQLKPQQTVAGIKIENRGFGIEVLLDRRITSSTQSLKYGNIDPDLKAIANRLGEINGVGDVYFGEYTITIHRGNRLFSWDDLVEPISKVFEEEWPKIPGALPPTF